jgi:hypothetical protein
MESSDLSVIVSELRRKGFDARSLGHVGIVVWVGSEGQFFPAERREEVLRRFLQAPIKDPAASATAGARY